MIRAKFTVTGNMPTPGSDGFTIMLAPVTSGSEENAKFFQYTPGGSIMLTTINAEAAARFTASKEFYVDFTEVGEDIVLDTEAPASNSIEVSN